jgi:hypothetical protein
MQTLLTFQRQASLISPSSILLLAFFKSRKKNLLSLKVWQAKESSTRRPKDVSIGVVVRPVNIFRNKFRSGAPLKKNNN